jgi:hypothetical protein
LISGELAEGGIFCRVVYSPLTIKAEVPLPETLNAEVQSFGVSANVRDYGRAFRLLTVVLERVSF